MSQELNAVESGMGYEVTMKFNNFCYFVCAANEPDIWHLVAWVFFSPYCPSQFSLPSFLPSLPLDSQLL
jgi:hypothetical protein